MKFYSTNCRKCCRLQNHNTRERKALLKFKESLLEDPFSMLFSWEGEDCCSWGGVGCDNSTGHITSLSLVEESLLPAKKLGSNSLSELKHLSELDLTGFNFQNNTFPYIFGNLSTLRVLDLNSATELVVDDLTWIYRLSLLEHLDLSYVDLSQTKDLLKVLNILPFIQYLDLSFCNLHNTNLDHSCVSVNYTLAKVLYLSLHDNLLDGELPCFLNNMTLLTFLDLSFNNYNSLAAHSLPKLSNLVRLNLGYNSFSNNVDWIFEFLGNKCYLKSLILRYNQFHGDVSTPFRNLSRCWYHNLETLGLGGNKFNGHLPEEIGELKKLRELDLSNNVFINGEIPLSLGQLSNLKTLVMYNTSLDGIVFEEHFANLSKLSVLYVSSFNFKVKSDWVPPFQLEHLYLESCDIGGGKFPQWVQLQTELIDLTMINCSISDTLSNFLYNFNKNLYQLDLSNNHIEGPIRDNIGQMLPVLYSLHLEQNSINGSLPDSLCEMKSLQLMDLSENNLSGNIPKCLGNLTQLEALILSSNELSGVIPNSVGGAYSLIILSLANNSLTGELPNTMKNCTQLRAIDIGENNLMGKLPMWIGNHLLDLRVLRLKNNNFFGLIPVEVCQLVKLQIIDLANNNFNGVIPNCFGNLSGMVLSIPNDHYFVIRESFNEVLKGIELKYFQRSSLLANLDLSNNNLVGEIPWELTRLFALNGLNLSHNHLIGKIPERIGDMKSMESLDFSDNHLSGIIPSSLSDLNFLSYLNLSHNNFSGRVPTGHQLQTLDNPSIYQGNPQLCGVLLPKQCEEMVPSVVVNHVVGFKVDDDILFAIIVICGVATGFWGVIGGLVFNRRWRHVYFKFVDAVISRMLRL